MRIKRIWTMPSKWTFKMKPVQDLFERFSMENWIDPFAGRYSPAEITNDIEQPAKFNLDGLEFLKAIKANSVNGALFDPPYSTEQCLRKYTPKFKGTAGRTEYWTRCKIEIARIIKVNGYAICFGWNSCGIGKKRGFDLIEVVILCHGACHNDTIITVERKITG